MNLMLPAAVCGFLYVEVQVVRRAMKRDAEKFDFAYYWRKNWLGLVANLIGTVMMYMLSPAVLLYAKSRLAGWLPDLEAAAAVSDYVLAPVVGAAIGLFGARFVRWAMNKGNGKLQ